MYEIIYGFDSLTNDLTEVKVKPAINKGWSCPICGHIWAPNINECIRCNIVNINISPEKIIIYDKTND